MPNVATINNVSVELTIFSLVLGAELVRWMLRQAWDVGSVGEVR